MSTRALLDPNDEEAREQVDSFPETDTASQITLLNVPDPDPKYDSNTVAIWDNRYSSLAGFAAYVQYCITLGRRECLRISAWFWRKSWTAEVCSFAFAILSLIGLVVTLSIYNGRPIPEWPHLITINSVVSLFALCMRIGVGVVLAEGNVTQAAYKPLGSEHIQGSAKLSGTGLPLHRLCMTWNASILQVAVPGVPHAYCTF